MMRHASIATLMILIVCVSCSGTGSSHHSAVPPISPTTSRTTTSSTDTTAVTSTLAPTTLAAVTTTSSPQSGGFGPLPALPGGTTPLLYPEDMAGWIPESWNPPVENYCPGFNIAAASAVINANGRYVDQTGSRSVTESIAIFSSSGAAAAMFNSFSAIPKSCSAASGSTYPGGSETFAAVTMAAFGLDKQTSYTVAFKSQGQDRTAVLTLVLSNNIVVLVTYANPGLILDLRAATDIMNRAAGKLKSTPSQ